MKYYIIILTRTERKVAFMKEIYQRTASLIGEDAQRKLFSCRVLIFGIGGVGGHLCEALARAGIGHLTLVDSDRISKSNINRQLFALHSTLGMKKVEAARDRICDIDPDIEVICRDEFFLPENSHTFDFSQYDYIADCIDTVSGKLEIATKAYSLSVPVISAMGAANKLHADAFEVSDIFKTSVCPLARVMRTELKKRGVKKLKVVYSKEEARKPQNAEPGKGGRPVPASISYVPSAEGLIMAQEIILDLIRAEKAFK